MNRFETVIVDKTAVVERDGLEISCFIAGVNSGVYGLPYIIQVRTWASKWGFKKFFFREAHLTINDVTKLKNECDKVIAFYHANKETTNR